MYTKEYISVLSDDGDHGSGWRPVQGEEATAAIERRGLDEVSARDVVDTSARILSKCVSPSSEAMSGTGLVVGYVQSGKTLSFTTVTALANDNGFGIVVVIAGMTNELAGQSRNRLLTDLGVEQPFSRWAEFFEPTIDDTSRIRDVLAEMQDAALPQSERRTVLITLKKNHARLQNLFDVFRELRDALQVPALVIDDEADQASLNNLVRNGELSTTYRILRDLRQLLPRHTFLQYTATPQAPILINLIDFLSPDFCVVLNPGQNYVGGRDFFVDHSPYVVDIPVSEVPTVNNEVNEVPRSLLRALQLFFVGVVSGELRRDGRPPNRSMMVHPARERVTHAQYHTWVQSVRNMWMDTLDLPEVDPDRQELFDEFRDAHSEISKTVHDLEPFERISERLLWGIRRTYVRLVNSLAAANRDIRWKQNYSWILVGGQVLDRGFTVEGLTVTYMPRGPGVGNADTIQQRARFLGYKQQYLGYCRIFLDSGVSDLYRKYVRHEEDMRAGLLAHMDSGRPMSEFKRVFLLDQRLRPTRQSVIDIDYMRPHFSSGWCVPDQPHDISVAANRHIVEGFVESQSEQFVPNEGHPGRRPHQRHLVASGVSLKTAYEELLIPLHVNFEDSGRWIAALILIDRYLGEYPDAVCTVYQMRPSQVAERLLRNGRIVNLFQGEYPVDSRDVYPGDRALRASPVTLQLHTVTLRESRDGRWIVVARDVKFAAMWMAPNIRDGLIVQRQGGY